MEKTTASEMLRHRKNPGQVVVSLLEKSRVDWVIVTNGKHWRLYYGKAHSKATNFYEIDVEEVLAQQDPAESFKYFWLFFRRQAFERSLQELLPAEKEKALPRNFLEELAHGSAEYAKSLGSRLKERVFEQIFPHFAEGFTEYIRNHDGLQADLSQDALDQIFQGTLTFLYRLLFLLYAESRDLLPVKETRGYYEKSLKKLKEEIAASAKSNIDDAPNELKKNHRRDTTHLYNRLYELFSIIDRGDSNINVPTYNGGLFLTDVSPDDETPEAVNARFLSENKIPDLFLALGLDLLARDMDEKT